MVSMKKGKPGVDWLIHAYEAYVLPRTLKRVRAVVCSSRIVRDTFLRAYRNKSTTITSGVDTEFFAPAAKPPTDTLLFVGSLNKLDNHKGVNYLLEAMVEVVARQPKAKLLVAGTGTGMEYYKDMARRLGVAKQVHFLGPTYGKDIRKAYRGATMFVLPSTNESAPLTILEAMATGIPVVSTRVGGIPDLVDDRQTGYLVEPANVEQLAEKINYLLAHPAIAARMGRAGRKKAVADYTWEMQAAKTDAVLTRGLQASEDSV